jgi:pyridoxal phosphate enzyme (YggS family)
MNKAPAEMTLKQRYEHVKQRVASAAQRAGVWADGVVVVAVTKYAAIDQVRELIELGNIDLGENHVQNLLQRAAQIDEFLQRHRQLSVGAGKSATLPRQVRWHMIGHLQRNKVRKLLGVARLIHSVDSLRLAEEIHNAATRLDEPVEVLIEVNVSAEKSKFGIAPAAARHLLDQMDTMMSLRPRGLMCMAPISEDPERSRPVFERCRELFDELRKIGVGGERFDILSMGMSQDFEVAIECGANLVRVGTAIFGEPAGEGADGLESND